MNAELKQNDNELIVDVEGRLDTKTSPELQEILFPIDDKVDTVIFDLEDLIYISSSGLRILISVLKVPGPTKKKVIVRHPNEMVKEVLTATGLDEIMEIE